MSNGTANPQEAETVDNGKLKNDVSTPDTPTEVKVEDNSEVEKLRKQLQQEQMEKNQLRNKLEAEEKAKAEAEAKELEEQNKYKDLYEQTNAKLEAIETEAKEKEQKEALSQARNEVLADYSDEVKALADEAGISLSEADEASKALFKEKLDKISTMIGTQKVGANNPGPQGDLPELSTEELRVALKDPDQFHKLATSRLKTVKMMTRDK